METLKLKCWVKTIDSQVAIEEQITVNIPDEISFDEKAKFIDEEVAEWKNNNVEWGYDIVE